MILSDCPVGWGTRSVQSWRRRVKAHQVAVAADDEAVAVVLDLVRPITARQVRRAPAS